MSVVNRVEELFLRIFKVTVIVMMGLALVAALVGLGVAVTQYFEKPVPIEPPPVAKQEAPSPQAFIDTVDKKPQSLATDEPDTPAPSKAQALDPKVLADSTARVVQCAKTFTTQITQPDGSADVGGNSFDFIASGMERVAKQHDQRGNAYLTDAARYLCATLEDKKLIEIARLQQVGDYPVQVLNFHIKAWDDAVAKHAAETRALQVEHTAKVNAEEERVAQLKTSALQLAMLAGGAFTLFMALAFYLIFAKIETNLREMRTLTPPVSPQEPHLVDPTAIDPT